MDKVLILLVMWNTLLTLALIIEAQLVDRVEKRLKVYKKSVGCDNDWR